MKRTAYHAEYYKRTAARRRKLKNDRDQRQRWAPRLVEAVLAELAMPAYVIVLPRRLIQRPTLRLSR